jgi:hypothetical protein
MEKTREEWLVELTQILRDDFNNIGINLHGKIKVSCGFPLSSSRDRSATKINGQCWSETCSNDGNTEIFISPTIDDSLQVAHTLVHELVHAGIGVDKGHGKQFRKAALAIGLTGRMRATTAGSELTERLNGLIATLGSYPHASISPLSNGRKKQSTRLLKVVCPFCGHTFRQTAQWLEIGGTPNCWCCKMAKMEAVNCA